MISRRAYEIWDQNGRPDGCELDHWLQAEKELDGRGQPWNGQYSGGQSSGSSSRPSEAATVKTADNRPLQGTRGAPPAGPRDAKRPTSPFGERAVASSGGQTAGAKRR